MAWAGTGPTRIPGLQQREDHAHKHARRPSARSYANSPCSQTFRDRMTCQPFSAAPRSIKMALLLRRSRMMPQPATRSNRRACEAPRSCTTPHGRMSFRYRVVVRFPFDSGCADQSRDRRDVPQRARGAFGLIQIVRDSFLRDRPTIRSSARRAPARTNRLLTLAC